MESASHAQPAPSEPAAAHSEARRARRRKHAIRGGTALTVIGLAITLVFNTMGVRDTANQQKRTREAAQLSLFTQLDQELDSSVSALRSVTLSAHPTQRQQAVLDRAYDDMNYLAWLFNNGYLTLPGTKELVFDRLCRAYRSAVFLGDSSSLREVKETVRSAPRCLGRPG